MSEQEQAVGRTSLAARVAGAPAVPIEVPAADEEWDEGIPHGFARVYYGDGPPGIRRPVVMADGFNLGRSNLDWLYQGLDGAFPLITTLRRRGRTVILLGFDERTAPITANAQAAIAVIQRTIASQVGDDSLTVGGFSMGGLITRFALANMEYENIPHRTGLYFSYDTPHRGGHIPIGIQAFAHFIPGPANDFATQMNSPAAKEMLWRHYDSEDGTIRQHPDREDFLQQLRAVGWWPMRPRKIGVANGSGEGMPVPVEPGEFALTIDGLLFPGTNFRIQATGDDVTVAELVRTIPPARKVVATDGFPEIDGAPGGTLDSYRIIADALEKNGGRVTLLKPTVCFVPTVSAVAIRDLDDQDDLYAKVDALDPNESELDEFLCSSITTPHTAITEELCTWILDRLPD
ncbi:esterase/lipase family protein [Micromonospora sp. NPDC050187]|uniref:esterase/lipase family protein n=1 Tax=Micromonospora sp. NPDC050187 TaxID=3364277 RepID=UPI0037AF55D3